MISFFPKDLEIHNLQTIQNMQIIDLTNNKAVATFQDYVLLIVYSAFGDLTIRYIKRDECSNDIIQIS